MGLLARSWAAFWGGVKEGWRGTRYSPAEAEHLYRKGAITRRQYTEHLEAWWDDDEWENGDAND